MTLVFFIREEAISTEQTKKAFTLVLAREAFVYPVSSLKKLKKADKKAIRGVEIRKHKLSETDDFMQIRERIPQASFDLGCQGSLTKKLQKSAFQELWSLISASL